MYTVPQQFWRDLPWLKGNGWRWFAGQLCGFLLEYGHLAHWGTWPGSHQQTQLIFELSDKFQWGKGVDIGGLQLLGTLPLKIYVTLTASFVLTGCKLQPTITVNAMYTSLQWRVG